MQYILRNTFSDRVISTHRSVLAAVKAQRKHARAVRRANGQKSYIPTVILNADGKPADFDALVEADATIARGM